jgi:carbon-monoxide dehydrogenase small subunit
VHLADFLRHELGLTGTHVGCEQGVCGNCTVIVDGAAVKSCLMLAAQADGCEVRTVESLASDEGGLNELQQSFKEAHARQCGFCTPGFLMSAYDLLRHRPDVPVEDLPSELSGVLCRCTGYRNIVAAVGEVAAAYPNGVPGPLNCTRRTLAGRTSGSTPPPRPDRAATAATSAAMEISMPTGKPTAAIEVRRKIAAPVDVVWPVLSDAHRVAPCLPGAELTEEFGDDRYAGRAVVALGPVRLRFSGRAQVVERDAERHRITLHASGSDAGGSTSIRITVSATAEEGGTVLLAVADVYLSGRIAQFGRALAGDVGRQLFEQFAVAVEESALTGHAPRARRPNAIAVVFGAWRDRLRSTWRRGS